MRSKNTLKKWIEKQKNEKEDKHYRNIDGLFLKELRNKLELTQVQMANYLGVSKKTIEKWEQGVNPIIGAAARLIYLISKEPKNLEIIDENK